MWAQLPQPYLCTRHTLLSTALASMPQGAIVVPHSVSFQGRMEGSKDPW